MKLSAIARTIASESILLPAQVVLVLAAVFPVIALGALAYPIRHSWTEKIYRGFTDANDALSRFRLRMAGDPQANYYSNNLWQPTPTPLDDELDAVARYGAIMEKQGTAILDVSRLPLPKPLMKVALGATWRVAKDERMRNAVEHGYMNLANFQEGVGKNPIDCKVPEDGDPAKVAAILKAWLAWSPKVQTEMSQLRRELDELKNRTREETAVASESARHPAALALAWAAHMLKKFGFLVNGGASKGI
jgi:hypothetical protein